MRQEEATSGWSCCPITPDHHPVVGDAWVWRWGGALGSTRSEFRQIWEACVAAGGFVTDYRYRLVNDHPLGKFPTFD